MAELDSEQEPSDLEVERVVGPDRPVVGDLRLAAQRDLRLRPGRRDVAEGGDDVRAGEDLERVGEIGFEPELEMLADRERDSGADVEREEHAPPAVRGRDDDGGHACVLLDGGVEVPMDQRDGRHALENVRRVGVRRRRLRVPTEEHVRDPALALVVLERDHGAERG